MSISMHNPYDAPERQNKNILLSVILLSLFAHALVFVLILLANIFTPMLQLAPEKTNPTVNITLVPPAPPPPKTMFMPTTPQPNAPHKVQPVESANDTELQSQSKVARDSTSIMPDIDGKKHADSLRDSPSVQAPPKPEVSTTQPTPKQAKPEKPTPPHPNPAQAQAPPKPPQPPAKPAPPTPPVKAQPLVDDNGLPLLPMINAPTLAPPNSAAPEAAPKASQEQIAQTTRGALGRHGDTSPAAMASPLGKYKQMVYNTVGSYWYSKVDKSLQLLGVGSVHIQFTIHSDGSIDTKILDGGNSTLQMLLSISVNSLREPAPFDTFDKYPGLREQIIEEQGGDGNSFTDDFTFSVY